MLFFILNSILSNFFFVLMILVSSLMLILHLFKKNQTLDVIDVQ